MGEYNIDFTKDVIIVDGHICNKTEYEGIYKVGDKYITNWEEWCNNKSNKNLAMICLPLSDNEDIIEYVCNHNAVDLDMIVTNLQKLDNRYMEVYCTYYDSSLMFMGGTWL